MFYIKRNTKQKPHFSTHWHDVFTDRTSTKRVVTAAHTTSFEPQLLAQSVHEACMKAFGFAGEAELTALKVCKEVEDWLVNKEEVTSADIKRHAAAALRKYNPRAAYAYLPVKEYEVLEDQYGFIRL